MRNLVIKTIFISAVLFTCLFVGVFGLLSVCAPKTMAQCYANLGMQNLSLKCSDVAYNNSDDIIDQFVMFNKAVQAKNFELTKKYAKKLLENKNLDEFVDYLNAEHASNIYLQNEKNRILQKYVEAIYKTKHVNTATNFAFNSLNENQIDSSFCFAVGGIPTTYKFNDEQKDLIKTKYNDLYTYFGAATSFERGVVAVRLSEMLDVLDRFVDISASPYKEHFVLIKAELN